MPVKECLLLYALVPRMLAWCGVCCHLVLLEGCLTGIELKINKLKMAWVCAKWVLDTTKSLKALAITCLLQAWSFVR